ncbi:aldose 1-epimerase [Tengunoibacter tsumagoiensis]|uniref:Aldose 1-epimerase n=1 Tax=Tengunoibacter tsumagoiensis TaxID=2014871 RepID=A0A402A6U2_9CHLR|nr:aldose 1-epimerase [Tengunoibacter tsumagoiensis]GCE14745.1 aldose 1-epimerase [Tengunoibacter tsumagoiensis]
MTADSRKGKSPYSAHIAQDPEIASTVISLHYEQADDPTRSLTVGIAPELGSNLFRLRLGEKNLLYYDAAGLQRKDFTGNFVLWPFPNRVRERRYSYQGQDYSLEEVVRVPGDKALVHGLVFDQAWNYEQPIITDESASVTTFIDLAPGKKFFTAYPFESRLSLTYTLTQHGVSIHYTVENKGEKDLPFGFALHPYFTTLTGAEHTTVSIPANSVMEADGALLPTGRLLDVNTVMYKMFDLREPVPVSHLKLDHVYTDLTPGAPVILDYGDLDFKLHISGSDDFTHCVIYTLSHGAPFLCVEHQTCSTDAINLHHQGPERQQMAHLLEVKPGESSTGSLHYTIKFDEK